MNALHPSPVLSAHDIIRTIENLLVRAGPYSLWTIGLAVDIGMARATPDPSGLWNAWQARSEADARCAIAHFLQQSMMLDPHCDEGGTHVYIF